MWAQRTADIQAGLAVHRTSQTPRRVNQVCTTALIAGAIEQNMVLEESTIRKSVADIDHD